MSETAFGDALGGADGTGSPGELARFPDALAVAADAGTGSGTDADTWSSFALPSLLTSPGGGRAAAQALVDADPLPHVPPVPVQGGQWGQLQPAPPRPEPRRAQQRPAQRSRRPQPPAPAWAPRGGPAGGTSRGELSAFGTGRGGPSAGGTGRGGPSAQPGPASSVSESPTIRRRRLPPWIIPALFLIVFIILGYLG